MKKLMALIVIIMLFAMAAQAVDNPFTFSVSNQITLKGTDKSQMGMLQSTDDINGYSPTNDYTFQRAVINDDMKCSASITLAEIYTMGFWLEGLGEIGTGGDADRFQFRVGMDNGIQVVPDYLKIEINAQWRATFETDTKSDAVSAPTHTNFFLMPTLKFSGKVPDSGFDWAIKEDVELSFNPENWKDSDPTYRSWDGDAYSSATGDRVDLGAPHGTTLQEGVFDNANFITQINLNFEFFHFFAPEGITGTLEIEYAFKAKIPYSYYLEKSKELVSAWQVGFKTGLAGPSFGVYFWGETLDYLNTSAPVDGDLNSNYSWEGSWIGNEGNHSGDTPVVGWTGEFDDIDATTHKRPNLKLGPKVTFSYTKEWFTFGTSWKGVYDGLRRYDEDGVNDAVSWSNEIEISAKFAL